MKKVFGWIYFIAIYIGLVAVGRTVGMPLSAFTWVFIITGAAFAVYHGIPLFIEHGLPRLLRGRPDSEVERAKLVVFGALWLAIFVVAPLGAWLYYGGDFPLPVGDLFNSAGVALGGARVPVLLGWLWGRPRRDEDQQANAHVSAGAQGLQPGEFPAHVHGRSELRV